MFDALLLDQLIDNGWIQPISPDAVRETEDLFPFALEGLSVKEQLYGIPVFLCGNFLIYDQDCAELAAAEHITDLSGMSEILVVNSKNPVNRPQYVIEIIADVQSEANLIAVIAGIETEKEKELDPANATEQQPVNAVRGWRIGSCGGAL